MLIFRVKTEGTRFILVNNRVCRVQILEGGIVAIQAKLRASFSSSYWNGDVPMSLMASFALCFKERFVFMLRGSSDGLL